MEREDIIRDVLHAAGEFNNRKLWKRFTNYDCFGVRIAGQEKSMLGVVSLAFDRYTWQHYPHPSGPEKMGLAGRVRIV